MNIIESYVETYGVLPVINITDANKAVLLAQALTDGGLPLIEVTLRSDCSLEAIRRIKQAFPDMLVGAGTVVSEKSVDDALSVGADYVVSPGYDPELVNYCKQKGVVIVPGCFTPSEIQIAVKNGLRILKFFPAELGGGVAAIKLLSGPFPDVRFLPTGGITFENLSAYLENNKVIACGGSFMATAEMFRQGDFEGITKLCIKASEIAKNARKAK